MVSRKVVEEQLRRIGCNIRFWGRSEVNELGRILLDDEIIAECVNGEYSNGFALLVATNHRVLLVDKKPMLYLTVEDLRFDMITEFNYSHRMLNATVRFYTANKTLQFTSWNQARLRRLLEYIQQRVLEMRQQQYMAQQFQAAAAAQYAQLHAAQYYQPTPSYAPNLASAPQSEPAQPVQPPQSSRQGQSLAQPQYQEAAEAVATQQQPAATAPDLNLSQPAVDAAAGQPQPQTVVSRFAAKRTALGTYTRSKLPSFRRHRDHEDNNTRAESGEVYPQGYNPGRSVTDYGLPYEY